MREYISREAANDTINETAYEYEDDKALTALYHAADRLNDLPAADVVEVVRCGECEYRDYDGELYGKNVAVCTGAMAYYNTPDDWYCKMGKRKDRGQEDV